MLSQNETTLRMVSESSFLIHTYLFVIILYGTYEPISIDFQLFFFSDETMSYEAYNWRGLVDKTNHSKVIHCTNTQEPTGIYINIEGSKEEILQANTGKSSGRFVVYD